MLRENRFWLGLTVDLRNDRLKRKTFQIEVNMVNKIVTYMVTW